MICVTSTASADSDAAVTVVPRPRESDAIGAALARSFGGQFWQSQDWTAALEALARIP